MHLLRRMNVMLDLYERCQSSCEEHGTSELYKKGLSTVGFDQATPAPDYKSTVLTTRPQLVWYEIELNAHGIYKYTIYK